MFIIGRKTKEELNEIMSYYKTDRLWSWSKFNTYHTSPYEYYLKYLKHVPEDRDDCIYVVTGGMAHEIMEDLYLGHIKYEEMDEKFEDAWITAEVADLKFDRNDEKKNKSVKQKYYDCLKHFFNHHKMFEQHMEIERFVTAKIGDNVFQGYIDAIYRDKDGNFHILDWKTSSIYKGKKAENECGQLIVYAIALNQIGIPMDKIRISWDFLKYVSIDCQQANGKWATREIERNQIGVKLQTSVKMWLKKCGYEDKQLEYLDLLMQTNDVKCLPEDVQEKYKVNDCIVTVPITNDLLNKWTTDIIETISEIEKKEERYKNLKDRNSMEAEKEFWDSDDQVEKQSYYFSTLCAYSPNVHLPYKKYLDKLNAKKEQQDNIFAGIGEDVISNVQGELLDEDDMSWLNDL